MSVCPSFYPSIHQFCNSLRNGSLGFSDFWQDGKQLEYLKRSLFSEQTSLFHGNSFLTKFEQKGPKLNRKKYFLNFLEKCSLVFLENNLKLKLILFLIFHHKSHIWENSGSQVMEQNTDSQSSEKHGEWSWFFACR